MKPLTQQLEDKKKEHLRLKEDFTNFIVNEFNKNPYMWKLLNEYEERQKFWSRK